MSNIRAYFIEETRHGSMVFLDKEEAVSYCGDGEQPIELSSFNAEMEHDAAIGKIVWSYIDRMNDVCPEDTAEKILADFVAAVMPKINAAIEAQGSGSGEV